MSLYQHVFFDHYISKLDEVFSKFNVKLNFISVGACDGKADDTSIDTFMKKSNWNGLFVEPMALNYRDLKDALDRNSASDRATLLHAAVNETCSNSTILFTRPNAEEKDGVAQAHWIRRQIGHIVDQNAIIDDNHIIESVRCLTFGGILKSWSSAINEKTPDKPHQIVRPHAVKIDTEGNDHSILRSLLKSFHSSLQSRMLPFLILWECKVIGEAAYEDLKKNLVRKNYAVSNYGQDCFAILKQKQKGKDKSERIKENKNKGEKKQKSLLGGLLG
jgi:hypothetical protein